MLTRQWATVTSPSNSASWLRPLLIHVRREFFRYRLGYALGLKSEYAIRLYQWLKRWEFARRKTASIQQLRFELGATEVDNEGKIVRENLAAYKHFKNKAILPAIREINAKTDLSVSFVEEKDSGFKGRRRNHVFDQRKSRESRDAQTHRVAGKAADGVVFGSSRYPHPR